MSCFLYRPVQNQVLGLVFELEHAAHGWEHVRVADGIVVCFEHADEVGGVRDLRAEAFADGFAVGAAANGGCYSESGFRSVWTPALLGAGLAHEEKRNGRRTGVADFDFHFHWLRHMAISLMARAGMKPDLIAQRVDHADGRALIYRRYRHLYSSELRDGVSALDAFLAQSPSSSHSRTVLARVRPNAAQTGRADCRGHCARLLRLTLTVRPHTIPWRRARPVHDLRQR